MNALLGSALLVVLRHTGGSAACSVHPLNEGSDHPLQHPNTCTQRLPCIALIIQRTPKLLGRAERSQPLGSEAISWVCIAPAAYLYSRCDKYNYRMPMFIGLMSLHSKWIGLSGEIPNSSVTNVTSKVMSKGNWRKVKGNWHYLFKNVTQIFSCKLKSNAILY